MIRIAMTIRTKMLRVSVSELGSKLIGLMMETVV